eukprot:4355285-Amphidinium_carterae.1
MLMTYHLPTAHFDDSCTKVEDYYRNVYIDNSPGQVGALQKPRKPWPPWKKNKGWQYGSGKESMIRTKAKEEKTTKEVPEKDYRGKGKGKKGKAAKDEVENPKAKEKATTTTTTTTTTMESQKATTTERTKEKEMEESRKGHHYQPTTKTTGEERTKEEKETRATLFVTSVENLDTQATNV